MPTHDAGAPPFSKHLKVVPGPGPNSMTFNPASLVDNPSCLQRGGSMAGSIAKFLHNFEKKLFCRSLLDLSDEEAGHGDVHYDTRPGEELEDLPHLARVWKNILAETTTTRAAERKLNATGGTQHGQTPRFRAMAAAGVLPGGVWQLCLCSLGGACRALGWRQKLAVNLASRKGCPQQCFWSPNGASAP